MEVSCTRTDWEFWRDRETSGCLCQGAQDVGFQFPRPTSVQRILKEVLSYFRKLKYTYSKNCNCIAPYPYFLSASIKKEENNTMTSTDIQIRVDRP